jgi:hypothetical protein
MTEILRVMPDRFAGFSKDDALRQLEEEQKAERKRLEDLARGNASGGQVVVPVPAVAPVPAVVPQNPPASTPDKFRINPAGGPAYCLNGVEFGDSLVDLYLYSKPIGLSLLDKCLGGKTFDSWNNYVDTQESPHPTSARLYHAIFKALYMHKDQPDKMSLIESARDDLRSIINKHRIITMTKIQRQGTGCAVVAHRDMHSHGTGACANYTSAAPGQCILDETDRDKVEEIYNWLTGNATSWALFERLDYGEKRIFSIVPVQSSDDGPRYTALDANTKPSKHGYAIGVSILKAEPK